MSQNAELAKRNENGQNNVDRDCKYEYNVHCWAQKLSAMPWDAVLRIIHFVEVAESRD